MPKPVSNKAVAWGNFKELSSESRYRMIWRSFGGEKTGKDHFGLTAPGPIAIQSFDIGLEGVVEKFLKQGKDIRATNYEFDKNECNQEAAQAIRDQFIEDYDVALKIARTIIWDTETELWELFRYAEFGEMSDAPKNYVSLNSKYRDLIQRAYDTGVNLQLIQKVKERWGTVKKQNRDGRIIDSPFPTGEMEPVGFKECGYITQANFKHSWNKEDGFVLEVVNCRQNMGIAGEKFTNIEFPELAQIIFPESEEGDWQ